MVSPCIKYVQYRLRVCRQAEGNSLFCIPQPVLRVCLSLYCTPSAFAVHLQPVLHILNTGWVCCLKFTILQMENWNSDNFIITLWLRMLNTNTFWSSHLNGTVDNEWIALWAPSLSSLPAPPMSEVGSRIQLVHASTIFRLSVTVLQLMLNCVFSQENIETFYYCIRDPFNFMRNTGHCNLIRGKHISWGFIYETLFYDLTKPDTGHEHFLKFSAGSWFLIIEFDLS